MCGNCWHFQSRRRKSLVKKKETLYIGRVTRRLLLDESGSVDMVDQDSLKPATAPSSTAIEEPPEHLPKDIGLFKVWNTIAGTLDIQNKENKKWWNDECPLLHKYYSLAEKLNRKKIFCGKNSWKYYFFE